MREEPSKLPPKLPPIVPVVRAMRAWLMTSTALQKGKCFRDLHFLDHCWRVEKQLGKLPDYYIQLWRDAAGQARMAFAMQALRARPTASAHA